MLEDRDNYYIDSELLNGGELYDRVIALGHISEDDVIYIIR